MEHFLDLLFVAHIHLAKRKLFFSKGRAAPKKYEKEFGQTLVSIMFKTDHSQFLEPTEPASNSLKLTTGVRGDARYMLWHSGEPECTEVLLLM